MTPMCFSSRSSRVGYYGTVVQKIWETSFILLNRNWAFYVMKVRAVINFLIDAVQSPS